MKRTNYTILLIAIISISTIGFLGIGIMEHNSSQLCPLSNTTCPQTNNPISITIHHISGLTSINKINITSIGVLSLLLLLIVFIKTKEPTIQLIPLKKQRSNEIIITPYIKQLLFWLTLHNKRDPHLLAFAWDRP